jgi:predicted ATPase
MGLESVWVKNYRSLVDISFQPSRLTVVVGANGSGKTNLYRALRLLTLGAEGGLASALLAECGMPSILFAGDRTERKGKPVRVTIGVTVDDFSYELSIGLPPPQPKTPFVLDPEIKEELIWFGPRRTPNSTIADRSGTTVILKDSEGLAVRYPTSLDPSEPFLAQIGDPGRFPEVFGLRGRFGRWRFYYEFPTDPSAPARRPQVGVRTPILSNDGNDLAAAVATIFEIGDGHTLRAILDEAFPDSGLEVEAHEGVFSLTLQQPGLLRPTRAIELSDGTLHFLYLTAALLTPTPPGLLVLNEPEAGLHDPVLEPLAELIGVAAEGSQVIVTTHSELLAEHLHMRGADKVALTRRADGATVINA